LRTKTPFVKDIFSYKIEYQKINSLVLLFWKKQQYKGN